MTYDKHIIIYIIRYTGPKISVEQSTKRNWKPTNIVIYFKKNICKLDLEILASDDYCDTCVLCSSLMQVFYYVILNLSCFLFYLAGIYCQYFTQFNHLF